MEETTTVETVGAESESLQQLLVQASTGELTRETFRSVALAACRSRKSLDELRSLVDSWDGVAGSIGDKAVAGVLHGYSLLLCGRTAEAGQVLDGQKRQAWGLYHLTRLTLEVGRSKEAATLAAQGCDKFPQLRDFHYLRAQALAKCKESEEALGVLTKAEQADGESSLSQYTRGCVELVAGNYREAIDALRKAVELDNQNQQAFFLLGYLLDLYGSEAEEANDEAIAAYEQCVQLEPVHCNAVMNLGLLYEDRERYHDSIKCYETLLTYYPNHMRAMLYLGDAQAATHMFYDKDQEKKADRQSQVLKIPVTDFELSVRSRNCLQKMDIRTLGDLIMKTEQELLSYKNFGETSLEEIKMMLNQKGLRLGQGLEETAGDSSSARNPLEATANPEILDRSIDELDLSVRSRRCMERLGVRTVRELINKTEVELMAAKNFGMTSLNEIKRKLTELGLSLRG